MAQYSSFLLCICWAYASPCLGAISHHGPCQSPTVFYDSERVMSMALAAEATVKCITLMFNPNFPVACPLPPSVVSSSRFIQFCQFYPLLITDRHSLSQTKYPRHYLSLLSFIYFGHILTFAIIIETNIATGIGILGNLSAKDFPEHDLW